MLKISIILTIVGAILLIGGNIAEKIMRNKNIKEEE